MSPLFGTQMIEELKERTGRPFLKEEKNNKIGLYQQGATAMCFMAPTMSKETMKPKHRNCLNHHPSAGHNIKQGL